MNAFSDEDQDFFTGLNERVQALLESHEGKDVTPDVEQIEKGLTELHMEIPREVLDSLNSKSVAKQLLSACAQLSLMLDVCGRKKKSTGTRCLCPTVEILAFRSMTLMGLASAWLLKNAQDEA